MTEKRGVRRQKLEEIREERETEKERPLRQEEEEGMCPRRQVQKGFPQGESSLSGQF